MHLNRKVNKNTVINKSFIHPVYAAMQKLGLKLYLHKHHNKVLYLQNITIKTIRIIDII